MQSAKFCGGLKAAVIACALVAAPLCLRGEGPIIPPVLARVSPAGLQRGTTATFQLEGRGLIGARALLFDAPGLTAKILNIAPVHEEIKAIRLNVDLDARVPQGVKSEGQVEITASKEVEPGLHWFRIQTPNGTSNLLPLAVGFLPEVHEEPSMDPTEPQAVKLPATITGSLSKVGEQDTYRFDGKAGQELVFQVVASRLDSRLKSLLVVRDASGQEIARAGEYSRQPDAVLTCKLPKDGEYTISIADRDKGGGEDYFYRINAGSLPYVTAAFPLGVPAGEPAMIKVQGVNLGNVKEVQIQPPAQSDGWTTTRLVVATPSGLALNKPKLAAGDLPEVFEQEPNNSSAEAQAVTIPVTINGHIDGAASSANREDEDYFRFHAAKGQHLVVEVAAARLGSPLDSVIEVLDSKGEAIQRATIRCLYQTQTTLFDRDSKSLGIRLVSTTGLHENDYLMVGDELDRISLISDQPDSDIFLEGFGGERAPLLGTSPSVRPLNTAVYKVQILPPDAQFPPNGLPVFHLTERNDDGGPGYGPDSRLDFDVPQDGDYVVHLKDVRNWGGPDYAYRLTVREEFPDFALVESPENPNIPQGGSVPVTISANRLQGYKGRIGIEVKGLPAGAIASQAEIPAGQDSTVVILSASANTKPDMTPAPIEILGHAQVNGREITRLADPEGQLKLAAVIPPPDVVVRTEPTQVAIVPGQEMSVTIHVDRKNGFKGRVPCDVVNLPPGVRVVNLGLNGVLINEDEDEHTFKLRAENWAKPIVQPFYVVARVESNSTTLHASPPLALRVENQGEPSSTVAAAQNPLPVGNSTSSAAHKP